MSLIFHISVHCTSIYSSNFRSKIKEPTCYKSLGNASCIVLILTNCQNHFQKHSSFKTGLSDFHKIIVTLFKSKAPQQSPNVTWY